MPGVVYVEVLTGGVIGGGDIEYHIVTLMVGVFVSQGLSEMCAN